ncbi:MAG: hypothetical protein FD165_1381 [Gammaproteobacteria bacterium]|nr:MAG: hypothetical protein FD165_1381 [Gammaproteobacteria bacterium]TND04030.1 MAG: hypothetical protein FD120_1739 [Gammaproteobacteria bacterium]
MFKSNYLLLSLVVILCAGCSTIRVSQDYVPNTDFASMGSFAWQSDSQPETGDIRLDDPLLNERIRTAIERTFASRYAKAERASANFLIAYTLGLQQKIKSDDTQTGVMVGTGSRGTFGGFGIGTGSGVETYDQVILFIDVLDPQRGKLLWRGKGTDIFSEHAEPEEITRQVNELVEKILAKFPP